MDAILPVGGDGKGASFDNEAAGAAAGHGSKSTGTVHEGLGAGDIDGIDAAATRAGIRGGRRQDRTVSTGAIGAEEARSRGAQVTFAQFSDRVERGSSSIDPLARESSKDRKDS